MTMRNIMRMTEIYHVFNVLPRLFQYSTIKDDLFVVIFKSMNGGRKLQNKALRHVCMKHTSCVIPHFSMGTFH